MSDVSGVIELLKYEISVDGKGIIDGGRVHEAVLVGKKNLNVRKAYACNGKYNIGWVYDYDVSYCMICMSEFGWFIRRHHCRGCGYVVCGECSKYKAKIAGIPEEMESRICCNCYKGADLTPGGRFSPASSFTASSFDFGPGTRPGVKPPAGKLVENVYGSPIENDMQRHGLIEEDLKRREVEDFETVQARNYAHAYRVMRGIVPPDITSTNLNIMLRQGLPPLVAKRVWTCGALWLICMHSSDIGKIHIADLRSRYATVGLDIVEMRAIWNILPKWSHDDLPNKAKAEWRDNFKIKLDTLARAEMGGCLNPEEARHPVYQGEEPILVYNHRIPLDAKYDKIDTYGHVIYSGIDSEGNIAPMQFYADPNPIQGEEESADASLSDQHEGTPSTVAQGLTPTSISPFSSPPVSAIDVSAESPVSRLGSSLGEEDPSLRRQPSSTRGIAASKYKDHLDSVAGEVPSPPVSTASPRRRPPPLPAASVSGASPLISSRKMKGDSWLNTANMPDSPNPSEQSMTSPALPVIDPNAITPPPAKPSSWKPTENPEQRIGGGYGTAARMADSDDEMSQRYSSPEKTPMTPISETSTPGCSSMQSPTLSPLVTHSTSFSSPPVQVSVALKEVSLSELKSLLLKGDADSISDLFDSGNIGSRSLKVNVDPPLSEAAASQIFMQICREPDGLKNVKETLATLVKDFRADVNYVGPDGKSGLIALLLQPELARLVINLGASIFQKGAMTACPLSICLELSDQGIIDDGDFIIDAFERSNNFNCMSRVDAMDYFTILVKAGRHVAASRLVALNRVQVSASDASKIMTQCNFEAMKDSLAVYELLEKLGGQF